MKLQNFCALWPLFFHVIILFSLSLMTPTKAIGSALGDEADRFAMLKFKESIANDPHGVLSSWNDSFHFCNWLGITCGNPRQRITALNLEGYDLRGTISPHIGNLSFLRFINLQNNSFSGEIPQQVGRLSQLQHLNLSFNMLEGNIPANLSYCSKLRILRLRKNKLTGMIPVELGSLVRLEQLGLDQNNLTGGIPSSLGNVSSLAIFSVTNNNLVGTIPDQLGKLKSLTFFSVAANSLSGKIPLSLYNISSLRTFSITNNQFKSSLPPNIGLTLPNLQVFQIAINEFFGMIPKSFSNASQIRIFDIGENNFFGQVPVIWGNLPDLEWFNINNCFLGNNYSSNSLDFITSLTNCSKVEFLDFSTNNFGGVLPHSVANLSTRLTQLFFGGNKISGNIPTTLENWVNLINLNIWGNLFTGIIPTSLGKLHNLQVLYLQKNLLSGKIPSSIGNLTQLSYLYLGGNMLEGSIPSSIGNCRNLQHLQISKNSLSGEIPKEIFRVLSHITLDLSQNSLTGSVPLEVGKLKNINGLDLSENNLTGKIPETIGDCESLEYLYLLDNFFQGVLPSSLSSLRGLQRLDISRNNLAGEIPKDLQTLRVLLYLNLSFNHLEGEVPKEGIFQNTSAVSLVGNTKLCGGVPKLQLPPCPLKASEQQKRRSLILTIIIVCVVAFFLLVFSFLIFNKRKKLTRKSSSTLSKISFLSKVSYKNLYKATSGFSPSMLIGTGSFGSVYKGILDQEEIPVAVKVFNLQQKGSSKSFIAECNALRNIRHRNLVKILTCCSSVDYNGNDFKALVFEYMSNGSLEKRLHLVTDHENLTSLNLIQRLNIAIDVATAVHYLHDHCDQPIIHCDLKPSNILLDDELIAHVGDFGLARLISNANGLSKSLTSTAGIMGTVGYTPPEYAMVGEVTKQGDVYSYGILILEMFTGKRPTDEMFKDDSNIHKVVKMALQERLSQIVDSSLLSIGEQESNKTGIENPDQLISFDLRKCLVSVLEIGIACSKESPNERMNMGDVTRELQHIRNAYLGFGIRGQSQ